MRTKPVPPVRGLAGLRAVREALPLVPGSTDDCCRRLIERADVPDRNSARSWLAFLVAVGAAARDGDAYYRGTEMPETAALAASFRENVFGVTEVLDALSAAGSLTADAVFQRTRSVVPQWERNRDPEWESTWRDRTERLLAWAVVFDIVRKTDDGYRLTR
jgi:hypothetical protein